MMELAVLAMCLHNQRIDWNNRPRRGLLSWVLRALYDMGATLLGTRGALPCGVACGRPEAHNEGRSEFRKGHRVRGPESESPNRPWRNDISNEPRSAFRGAECRLHGSSSGATSARTREASAWGHDIDDASRKTSGVAELISACARLVVLQS